MSTHVIKQDGLHDTRRIPSPDREPPADQHLAESTRNGADHTSSLAFFRRLRAKNQPVFSTQEIMALQHLDPCRATECLLKQA